MGKLRSSVGLSFIILGGGVGGASAQAVTPPSVVPQINPGLITNQNQRNQLQIQQQTEAPATGPAVLAPAAPPARIVAPGGATFLLKQVTFDKSAFLTPQELDTVAKKYIGTRVDISQIQRLVKAVNDLYAAKGIVSAAATLPPQDLKGGTLRVSLIEGKLGKIVVKGNSQLQPGWVTSGITAKPGEVVDVPGLTRSVSLFNRTGNAQVQAFLQPGASFGLTDIQLAITEPAVNVAQVFIDNQGVPSVGEFEGGFLFQRYAPLGIDDKLTLYGVASAGDLAINAGYNIPVDPWGGRAGVSFTKGNIKIVQGPYKTLDIVGQSTISSANFSQPVFINNNFLVLLNAAVSLGNTKSKQSGVPTTNNDTDKQTAGITVAYTDPNMSISVSPTFSFAHTSFNVTDTRQYFQLTNGTYAATFKLPADFVVTSAGAYQASSASIISGDQLFQIGGPTTVRGYDTNSVAGPTGYYANLELHHSLSNWFNGVGAFAFFDRGAVYNTFPKALTLNSAGMGLTIETTKYLLTEVSAGFPLTKAVDKQPDYAVYFRVTARY